MTTASVPAPAPPSECAGPAGRVGLVGPAGRVGLVGPAGRVGLVGLVGPAGPPGPVDAGITAGGRSPERPARAGAVAPTPAAAPPV